MVIIGKRMISKRDVEADEIEVACGHRLLHLAVFGFHLSPSEATEWAA